MKILEYRTFEYNGVVIGVNENGTLVTFDGKEYPIRKNADGYSVVTSYYYDKNNKKKWRTQGVHRFVAMAFVDGMTEVNCEVNHKNYIRDDNRYENLEWVSHSENITYSVENGRGYDRTGINNPNYGNRKLSLIYANNKTLSKEKQSRHGAQNGRALPVRLQLETGEVQVFGCLSDAAQFLINLGIPKSSTVYSVAQQIRKAAMKSGSYRGVLVSLV